jgi:signal transduction histidine kinase
MTRQISRGLRRVTPASFAVQPFRMICAGDYKRGDEWYLSDAIGHGSAREPMIRSGRDELRVLASVTDFGLGISAENADRLFNALFTTKSRGVGMELPICRLIKQAQG